MGTRGGETGDTGLTLLPTPEYNPTGGASGSLKGHGDRTGQEAGEGTNVASKF